MSSRWFRFYDDALNDPKLLKLTDATFRGWVALLCVTSKNSGIIPPTPDLEFHLRMKPQRVASLIAELISAGLLDKTENGFEPHNWAGRQYLSDSTERVKRHREKRAAAGLEAQWSAPKALRVQIYSRDNHECIYCGSPDDLTLDHKTPEMRGGTHDPSNLQTTCRKCNASKRDLTHDEFVTRGITNTLLKLPQTTEQTTEQSRAEPRAEISNEEKVLRTDLMEAFGPSRTPNLSRAGAWLSKGYAASMILETVRELLARKSDIANLSYFDSALAERHANQPLSPVERLKIEAEIDFDKVASLFKKGGPWSKYAGPEPGQSGCKCPPEILAKYGLATPSLRRMDS